MNASQSLFLAAFLGVLLGCLIVPFVTLLFIRLSSLKDPAGFFKGFAGVAPQEQKDLAVRTLFPMASLAARAHVVTQDPALAGEILRTVSIDQIFAMLGSRTDTEAVLQSALEVAVILLPEENVKKAVENRPTLIRVPYPEASDAGNSGGSSSSSRT